MRDDVCKAVFGILHGEGMYLPMNSTNITLILKNENIEFVSNSKPISSCNILHKLVSKFICNRLKSIVPLIIFRTQSAFILDRLITENILVAYELQHSMKLKSWTMTIKLDMLKANDRIE